MKRFLITLQFMTRIPINKSFDVTRLDYAKGTIYFPIVGLIVGSIVSLIMQLLIGIFSPVLTALVGVITHVFITGGIHLDGFSDTCDGIFSGRGREKILEIMKDSRLGTFGGVGLIILLLTRGALYYEVLNASFIKNSLMIVLISSIAARGIVMFFSYKRRYARENEGLGDLFIGKVTIKELLINQVILISIIILIDYKFLVVYLLTLLIMLLVRRYIESILNGVTGDILGFSIELSEIIFMFFSLGLRGFLWS